MTSVTAATDDRRLVDKLSSPKGESLITVGDALTADPGRRWSVVLANPPFGRKSSVTMIGADGRESRDDLEIVRSDLVARSKDPLPPRGEVADPGADR